MPNIENINIEHSNENAQTNEVSNVVNTTRTDMNSEFSLRSILPTTEEDIAICEESYKDKIKHFFMNTTAMKNCCTWGSFFINNTSLILNKVWSMPMWYGSVAGGISNILQSGYFIFNTKAKKDSLDKDIQSAEEYNYPKNNNEIRECSLKCVTGINLAL